MADKPGGILATIKDLITRTKGLDDIHDDLAKVPKSDGTVSFNSTALGAINAEVDSALDTAIPASPTAGSVNKIVKDLGSRLPASGTLATVDDVGGGLTAKEKAFAGLGQPVLNEWFLDVADGAAPNSDFWTTVLSSGTAVVEHDYASNLPGYLAINTGSSSGHYAIVHTKDKKLFSPRGVVKICYETKLRLALTTNSTYRIGLTPYDSDPASGPGSVYVAYIHASNGTAYFYTGDGTTVEGTAISAYLPVNTWVTIRVEISSGNAKLYIDGTLRATHSSRVPTAVMYFYASANRGTSTGALQLQYVNVWTEME